MNKCAVCGTDVAVIWDDWSEQYLCEQHEEQERRKILTIDAPTPLWLDSTEGSGIVLSKVNCWVRKGSDFCIWLDGSEHPITVSTSDYPSFLEAIKEYWS